jgi:hypothetical protein
MAEATYDVTGIPINLRRPSLEAGFNPRTAFVFFGILAGSLFFIAYNIYRDISASGVQATTWLPFVLLGVALFIALGFEFVNGFHDTANAVATVIYTHFDAGACRGRLVRRLQLSRRHGLERRRCVRHHSAPSRRTDPPSGVRRGLRDGFRALDRRDHLEPRDVVSRSPRIELPHRSVRSSVSVWPTR